MFEIASLTPTYSAPVLETWPARSQKPEIKIKMTVLYCLDFEGRSTAMLTYMVYSPKGFTTNETSPGLEILLACHQ